MQIENKCLRKNSDLNNSKSHDGVGKKKQNKQINIKKNVLVIVSTAIGQLHTKMCFKTCTVAENWPI